LRLRASLVRGPKCLATPPTNDSGRAFPSDTYRGRGVLPITVARASDRGRRQPANA